VILLPPLVALAVLALYDPPWMLLLTGILAAALPALVLVVFAPPTALLMADQGLAYVGGLAAALALVVGLVGGIGGFVRARRGERWGVAQGFGTSTGVTLLLATMLVLGMSLASLLAHANIPSGAAGGYDIAPEATVSIVTSNLQFSPQEFNVPAGKLVEISVDNQDTDPHTFTYKVGGTTYDHPLPGGKVTKFLVRLDKGDVPYWCIPHSPDMKGTMHVV
jgi:plastocyanin